MFPLALLPPMDLPCHGSWYQIPPVEANGRLLAFECIDGEEARGQTGVYFRGKWTKKNWEDPFFRPHLIDYNNQLLLWELYSPPIDHQDSVINKYFINVWEVRAHELKLLFSSQVPNIQGLDKGGTPYRDGFAYVEESYHSDNGESLFISIYTAGRWYETELPMPISPMSSLSIIASDGVLYLAKDSVPEGPYPRHELGSLQLNVQEEFARDAALYQWTPETGWSEPTLLPRSKWLIRPKLGVCGGRVWLDIFDKGMSAPEQLYWIDDGQLNFAVRPHSRRYLRPVCHQGELYRVVYRDLTATLYRVLDEGMQRVRELPIPMELSTDYLSSWRGKLCFEHERQLYCLPRRAWRPDRAARRSRK